MNDSYLAVAKILADMEIGNIAGLAAQIAEGVDIDSRDEQNWTPLMYAVSDDNISLDVVRFLLENGAGVNAVNDRDYTALMLAVEGDAVNCVEILLQAGADRTHTSDYVDSIISEAYSMEIVRLLLAAGEDSNRISGDVRRLFVKVPTVPFQISESQYWAGKERRFGTTNPELMEVEFWAVMVRSGISAWNAKSQFQDDDYPGTPAWCFSRFGQSFTELPDGRFIAIAGEHEDSYDSDFCIYNDVVVYDGRGDFQIFGYPQDVFPPTDFHSTTLVGDYIYIIGNLGYYPERCYGRTPVYRLDCRNYQIEPVLTTGNNPGWIYNHQAIYREPGIIAISGGITVEGTGQEDYVPNETEYLLDLQTLVWS
jgi:hypothetical protein